MKLFYGLALSSIALFVVGCGSPKLTSEVDKLSNASYLADSEPVGAMPVGEAREQVEDGQEVTLVGLIGGSSKPFVDGLAAFTIVDKKVPYCADAEGCPTPWDYCCQTDAVKSNIATIKVVDGAGKPVAGDAKEMLNVKELSTVVVSGTAKRDDQGNLTLAASKIFVRAGEQ